MDGWVGRWVVGRTDGRMDEWVGGLVDGWMETSKTETWLYVFSL
jgi:hypothetical protein